MLVMRIVVRNLVVEYEEMGSGPVMLMLHGWKDSLRTFDALTRELVGVRIVRLDLPGFGERERPREAWGVREYAVFVQDFCAKLPIKPDVLVGHSFGGRVILKGLADGMLSANKIVLIGSAGVKKCGGVRSGTLRAIAKIGKALTAVPPLSRWREQLRRKLYETLGSDYYAAGGLKETYLKVIKEDLSASASRINTPTLLIWGARDSETPLEEGERLRALIRGSRLEVIPNASHFVHREESHKVAALIADFI